VSTLAAVRHRQGLTQLDVAKRAHLAPSLVGGWEAGWKVPQLTSLIAYADAMGYEVVVVPKRSSVDVVDLEQRRAS
jgi:transcriptional regulator with XRE-family HTH domain